MKLYLTLLLFFIALISCRKEEINHYSPQINFEISSRIFSDKSISFIDFDSEGNAWIGSGNELIFYSKTKTQIYNVESWINDISIGVDEKIWIGTRDKGLACFNGGHFSFWTGENAGLPRDYIVNVEAASDGSVWFGSSAHQLGGLMHFDGKKFELFTPENSIINQNLILGLKTDLNGNVFCFSEGTVTETKVFKCDPKNKWTKLGGDEVFYWLASLDVNSKSEVVITTDHGLSSCVGCYEDHVFIYLDGKWKILDSGNQLSFGNRMFIDKRDYIWVGGFISGNQVNYYVYDGKVWHHPKKNEEYETFVLMAKPDPENNIWFCTNKGIFIVNQ